jgi:hypothetical protein
MMAGWLPEQLKMWSLSCRTLLLQFLYNAFKMSSVFERAKPHYLDVHLCQTHPYIGLPYRKIEQKPTGQHLPITLGQCLEDVLYALCPSCYPSETVLLQPELPDLLLATGLVSLPLHDNGPASSQQSLFAQLETATPCHVVHHA